MNEIKQHQEQPDKSGNDNKEPKKKTSEEITATTLRAWFGITAKFLRILPSLKRITLSVACVGLSGGIVFITYTYYDKIVAYLISRNVDP